MGDVIDTNALRAAPDAPRERLDWQLANREVVTLGLNWLATIMEAEIVRLRASAPTERYRSESAMSDLAADWLLRDLKGTATSATPRDNADVAQRAYDTKRKEMLCAGQPAAIDKLVEAFGLSAFDKDVLLLALAPRLEAGFQALFGYLHDRLSLSHPSPHLALNLLTGPRDDAVRQLAAQRLAPDASLRRFGLIRVGGDLINEGAAALNAITLDERIADYLVGIDHLDRRLAGCLRSVAPVRLPKSRVDSIADLDRSLGQARRPPVVFVGPPGSGRRAAAAELARHQGLSVTELIPDRWLAALQSTGATTERNGFNLLTREAVLTRQAFLVDAGRRGEGEPSVAWRFAETVLEGAELPLYVVAEEPPSSSASAVVHRVPGLSDKERGEVWRGALGDGVCRPRDIETVSAQFRIGPQAIAAVASSIRRQSADRTGPVQGDRLWEACREACGPAIAGLAERIEPRFGWNDLVLPEPVMQDLRALAAQIPGRAEVLGRWGFARRWGEAGASALFAGASGTGKSMAAEVIANALELDLYRIELSGVVSKYIGETEKNLQRIFQAAESSGAVLLFDEADAIFGKRSEVKDAHDRYANIEVGYLLQAMERYRGLAILSTNMKSNVDQAFFRRFSYIIDFPRPDQQARERIWRLAIPAQTPTQGLDLARLAKMDLAGGSIVRIALNAAYLAAGAGNKLSMDDILQAAAAEYRKVEKAFKAP